MIETPPASLALTELGIPHVVFRHRAQVRSLEQAAGERGQRPEQVVRSIVFRLGESNFIMVLVAGPAQISWKKLRQHLGQSRLTMASETEVMQATGYKIGTVSPFGLAQPLRVLVDRSVLGESEISIGSGVPNTGVILKSADLRRALGNAEIVDFLGHP
jgi:Cys-tRNA(Pro)/Cys-tRNA(Cys) deacylase